MVHALIRKVGEETSNTRPTDDNQVDSVHFFLVGFVSERLLIL